MREYETILGVSVNTNSLSVAIEQFFSAGVDIGNTYAALKIDIGAPRHGFSRSRPSHGPDREPTVEHGYPVFFLKFYEIFSDFAHLVQSRA